MNKLEFKNEAKRVIDELYHKIEFLEEKKCEISEDARESYISRVNNLIYKRTRLQEKYQELEVAAEEKWEETKEALKNATSSVTEGVNELHELL